MHQLVAFSNVPPDELVLDWIIDDGQLLQGRPHRHAIFDTASRVIGIATGPCSVGRVVCCLLTEKFQEKGKDHGNNSNNSTKEIPEHHHEVSVSLSAPSKVYPDYKVGELVSIDNGSAALLPITNLGCTITELALTLKNNGKMLQFSRSVTQNARPRTEIQHFNLPYTVSSRTASGTYFPSKDGGTLNIRLGKNVPAVAGLTMETEITTYKVVGNPNSSTQRVSISIDQKDDHFIFVPGPASKFDTEITVFLVGSKLEFRTCFSYPEEGVIKEIHGKQTINLPTVPRIDQIDTTDLHSGGKSVTIWPNRSHSGSDEIIPDSDLKITLG